MFDAKDLKLKSEGSTTQGDSLAMAVCVLGLSVLLSKISLNSTGDKHTACAGDFVGAGKF